MIAQLLANPQLDLVSRDRLGTLLASNHKSSDNFAISLVWNTDDRHVGHARMCQQTILNLQWMDVFAATNDQVFDATSDSDIAIC